MIIAVALLAFAPQEPDWQYVEPKKGAAQEHAPPRAIPLFDLPPKGVLEEVSYRGTRRRYAQIRYGGPGTTRIAIAVDDLADGGVDLYVDADRDRRITATDKVLGAGPTWRLPLQLARPNGDEVSYETRPALLRLHTSVLAFAPIGYVEGHAKLGERTVRVRRIDVDGNDSYSDGRDRLLIDVNGDDRFDPLEETFFYASVLMIGDARWVVQEVKSQKNRRLQFAELEGTGNVRLTVAEALKKSIRSLTVTIESRDGMTLGLSAVGDSAEAPVGVYRVVAIDVTLNDPKGGRPWGFVFSAEGKAKRWFPVEKGKAVDLDPFAGLTLAVGERSDQAVAGEFVHLQPRLTTGDGLLINSCWRGQHTGFGHFGPGAAITLREPGGDALDTTTSGFA